MTKYLFDFDGTLVDSMPTFVSVMLKILDENEIKYDSDIVKIITPLGYVGTAKYFRELGVDLSEAELIEKMNDYAKIEYAENIEAKPAVTGALRELKRRGCSLNVLTASPHSVLDICLKRIGIYSLFDNVWSCEDFGLTKADVEIYGLAAAQMGASVEDVIFLDDNLNALTTARKSGMQVYGVYDASSEEYTEEIKEISDRYIRRFDELI